MTFTPIYREKEGLVFSINNGLTFILYKYGITNKSIPVEVRNKARKMLLNYQRAERLRQEEKERQERIDLRLDEYF